MAGRWLSPDPAGLSAANPANPQTWNRYAYVGGNPLSFADPSGLGVECRNSANAGSANCVRYSADCTQGAGFCPPQSMNRDSLAQITQPCGEECQYQGRVDDANNGTHYMDDPNVYSNGRFRVPPASGWFYESYGQGGSIGYDIGGWYYPAIFVNAANNGTLPNGDVPIYGLNGQGAAILKAAGAAAAYGLKCAGYGWAVQGGTMAASAPVIAKPFSTPGSSGGTSVASSLAGDYYGTSMTVPVGMPGTSSFRWTTTANWGRAAGRILPYVGTAVGAYAINSCLGGGS